MSVELSVIVPAFNEELYIEGCLRTIIKELEYLKMTFEIIPVDDGSRDRTLEIIRKLATSDERIRPFTNGSNRGKGFTVRHGVIESRGDYVLFSDVDLSTPITEYLSLRQKMGDAFEIAIGSRSMAQSSCGVKQPWYRIILGRMANFAIQSIVPALRGIKDTQCGFKLFKGKVARKIFPLQRNERWGFDFEILHIAKKFGYQIIESPVRWNHAGDSHIRLSDYPKTFLELLRVRKNEMNKIYDEKKEADITRS